MGATAQRDFAEEIRHRRFEHVAQLIRKGDISVLNEEARILLADYLEGKNLSKGIPPDKYRLENAELLYLEYQSLKEYGRTRQEQMRHVTKIKLDDNNVGNSLETQECLKLRREDIFARIKEIYPETSELSFKGLEAKITLGKKVYEYNLERDHQSHFVNR